MYFKITKKNYNKVLKNKKGIITKSFNLKNIQNLINKHVELVIDHNSDKINAVIEEISIMSLENYKEHEDRIINCGDCTTVDGKVDIKALKKLYNIRDNNILVYRVKTI